MSWLLNLYETYESNSSHIGKIEKKHNDQEYTLLPVSHTTQNAHIEVLITEEGEFHSARVVDKDDMSTLIPCTEDAANRAGSKIAPYPLHDKLSYVAGDYTAYGGEVKKEELFPYYINQLREWADSPFAVAKVKSIYGYLSKGSLIRDLVMARVLFADADRRIFDKWDAVAEALHGAKPPLYALVPGDPGSAFVRFNVYSADKLLTDVWKDKEMYDSFIQFYSGKLGDEELCYVSGKRLPSTDKHANKIRNAADKAKLISANDNSGFTFRGRFRTSLEAASISYEVSQKAHNALKWLINRQGMQMDQRVFLVWGNEEPDIPGVTEDMFSISPITVAVKEKKVSTNREFAGEVAKAFAGYRNRLHSPSKANVNILILDSATTGRMAVLYYRNMDKEVYLNRLVKWHSTCAWLHRYRKNEDGNYTQFYGAPATKDIAYAAYGPRAGDKIVKGLMERMLPCIIDERKIPPDIVAGAVQRASNPVAMERWEWEKTLSITCALINRRRGLELSLDAGNNDRDYLFGRLLAVADVLERRALGSEERESNALRYMSAYAKHPARTWRTIQDSLRPYQARLGPKGIYLSKLIDEIGSRMPIEAFTNKPLSDLYLLGFYSQRHELYQSKIHNADDASN
ncbi:type I-C CRISPR-associated protein Cas8c/Csd1 [Paenibacillus lycopersici]|uniref:Type I-C CRISPR-associated protein Cas8c/Csd1 n=1 Tax=Paenibacillus lycopersici TaxID=2704462 RepID=A0A6C0G304_9BACL|nr:type I-C CRISPR-associated protein Cas8c/Csd1 [Paenibacillus lycopersici]QHT63227.1 type I-C CRISPR-associated protein Cas8c/Csd1 [Paenibacillus lycopersici]